jgi:hypothetical protein
MLNIGTIYTVREMHAWKKHSETHTKLILHDVSDRRSLKSRKRRARSHATDILAA